MLIKFFVPLFITVTLTTSCVRQDLNHVPVVDKTYIHKYGVAVPSDFWTESGEHGVVVSTLADGTVVSNTYASGVLDGDTNYLFSHSSQVERTEVYANGVVVKETKFFFDGTPREEAVFENPQGGSDLVSKTVSSWYLNGTPRNVEQYVGNLLVNGEYYTLENQLDSSVENYQGTRIIRDDYGQITARDNISNGQLVASTTYHANGSPKENIPYQNGFVDGSKQVFHPGGEPNSIEQWTSGQQNGITIVYQHGEKFAEVPYKNGVKTGIERRYRDGTLLVKEISWENDQLHGPSKTYVGDSVKVDWFYRGEPTTKVDFDRMMNKSVVR